jgi:hypothetical protein
MMKLKGDITKDSGPIFFIVWKQLSPSQYKPVYKSEIKSAERGSQNWNAFKLDTQSLCGGDESQEIKIDFFRSMTSGDHKILGTTYTSLGDIKGGNREISFKGDNKATFVEFEVKRATSFLEYVFGGCNINLSIAIDFTLSNGRPNDPASLHTSDLRNNQYY